MKKFIIKKLNELLKVHYWFQLEKFIEKNGVISYSIDTGSRILNFSGIVNNKFHYKDINSVFFISVFFITDVEKYFKYEPEQLEFDFENKYEITN